MQRGSAPLVILLAALALSVISGVVIFKNTKPDQTKDPVKQVNLDVDKGKLLQTPAPPNPGFLSKTFLNPKPSEAIQKTEEKTYTSKSSDFELKYSSPLEAMEDKESEFNKRGNGDFRKNFSGYIGYEPGKVLEAMVVLGRDKSFENAPFTVWVFENLDGLDEQGWYKRYWYYPFLWGDFDVATNVHVFPKDEATISGRVSKSAVVYYQPGKPRLMLLSKDGKMYLFKVFTDSAAKTDGEKILADFKFTK
ncbi:hypothetical protein HYW46_00715 [Candidatus Daviesbacteria bacterium]|nr:hypothetical protein [Candidatus Daviesbacteria bacterium]